MNSGAMTSHFRLLAEIRWQVFRNTLRLKGKLGDLIAKIIVGILSGAVALTLGITFAVAAYTGVHSGKPKLFILLLWIVCGCWQLLPVALEGASPGVNFQEVARYPIRFRLYYLVHTAYGLIDPTALLCLTWLGCIGAGMAWARPGWIGYIAALLAAFALVNLMVNRVVFDALERILSTRRGRERFLLAVILLSVAGQFLFFMVVAPNPGRWGRALKAWLLPLHDLTPPGFVYRFVIDGQAASFLVGTTAMLAEAGVAALILRWFLWRKYRGEIYSEGVVRRTAVQVRPGWTLPGLPKTLVPIVEKEARYLIGNAGAFINFFTISLMALLFAVSSKFSEIMSVGLRIDTESLYPGLAGFAVLTVGGFAYNSFCYESRGFDRWVLAPISFRQVILAKNMVLAAILLANLLFITLVFSIRPGLPLLRVATVVTGVFYAGLTTLGAGNLFAVWSPAGIDYGGLRSRNVSGMAVLGAVTTQFSILGSLGAVMWASTRWGSDWLPVYCFTGLALAALAFYVFSVGYTARYATMHSDVMASRLN